MYKAADGKQRDLLSDMEARRIKDHYEICPKGPDCKFLHTKAEMMLHPFKFKADPCNNAKIEQKGIRRYLFQ